MKRGGLLFWATQCIALKNKAIKACMVSAQQHYLQIIFTGAIICSPFLVELGFHSLGAILRMQ